MDIETFARLIRMSEVDAVQEIVSATLANADSAISDLRSMQGLPPLEMVTTVGYLIEDVEGMIYGHPHRDPRIADESARVLFARAAGRAMNTREQTGKIEKEEIHDPLGVFDASKIPTTARGCAMCGHPKDNHPYRHPFKVRR